jgi:methylenetetrahydrofolate dehydrogenase (NADP+)/methenyltetrahydrofolate cyclohydrolase
MTAKLLDGKKLAGEYLEKFKAQVAALKKRTGRAPKLCVVLVGDDPASLLYDKKKMEAAREVGMDSELFRLGADTEEKELLALIEKLNRDESASAILVQLPLPEHIGELKVLSAVDPAKDVDGFHPLNQGRLAIGDETGLVPCTPLGIIRLLEKYDVEIDGARAAVISDSNIVGRPLWAMLLNRGATVATCHIGTKRLGEITRAADIIVSAAGKEDLIRASDVKPGAVVVDVAMIRDSKTGRLRGDADQGGVAQIARLMTPVPGGVGPMTVAMLIGNTIRAFCLQNGIADDEVQI